MARLHLVVSLVIVGGCIFERSFAIQTAPSTRYFHAFRQTDAKASAMYTCSSHLVCVIKSIRQGSDSIVIHGITRWTCAIAFNGTSRVTATWLVVLQKNGTLEQLNVVRKRRMFVGKIAGERMGYIVDFHSRQVQVIPQPFGETRFYHCIEYCAADNSIKWVDSKYFVTTPFNKPTNGKKIYDKETMKFAKCDKSAGYIFYGTGESIYRRTIETGKMAKIANSNYLIYFGLEESSRLVFWLDTQDYYLTNLRCTDYNGSKAYFIRKVKGTQLDRLFHVKAKSCKDGYVTGCSHRKATFLDLGTGKITSLKTEKCVDIIRKGNLHYVLTKAGNISITTQTGEVTDTISVENEGFEEASLQPEDQFGIWKGVDMATIVVRMEKKLGAEEIFIDEED